MNYRHHFHAGNFADVMKHVLLIRLLHALQKKEKGFLYLDTHAGRGRYDLTAAASGDTLARKAEWPEGIGRLMTKNDLPSEIAEYVNFVRKSDRAEGNLDPILRFYPGSPWIAKSFTRMQDRLALIEKHPAECAALKDAIFAAPGVTVYELDGYVSLRAMMPPPERRALVLIDPPFEAQDEFEQIVRGLREGLQRFPTGTFAIWYPLTERARVEEFLFAVRELSPPPSLTAELTIAGERSVLKMKGCGLMVINPPWQFDREIAPLLSYLALTLAQEPGGTGRVDWLVPEK